MDRNETLVKNINEELPYESTGAHKNKPNLADVFEKDEAIGNVLNILYLYYMFELFEVLINKRIL